MSDKEKRMAAMKKRFNESTPKISGRANLGNINQIKNFMFGKSKSMGIDDDIKGIATQKAKKKIADSKTKKVVKKSSSGGGQGQSKGNIYLRTGRNTNMTLMGGKGNAREVKPYKFDKDGAKPIDGSKNKKDNKKIVKVAPKTKTDSKSKVAATAGNTKNFASTMAMQKKLIAKGAKIKADGIMGPKTRAAMAKFMKAPVPKARPSKTMVDSFKKSNVSANKNKKAGIDGAMGDNKKPKTFKSSNSKLDSKGNYKGTNIKPTKLQLERMKKRRARASST